VAGPRQLGDKRDPGVVSALHRALGRGDRRSVAWLRCPCAQGVSVPAVGQPLGRSLWPPPYVGGRVGSRFRALLSPPLGPRNGFENPSN
jgi:hypothetical protein